MRVLLLSLVFTLSALAQPAAKSGEIRGTVVVPVTKAPILRAEVTVSEFVRNAEKVMVPKVVASAFTDANGAFVIKLDHLAEFVVDVKKAGYGLPFRFGPPPPIPGRPISLYGDRRLAIVNLELIRLGTLTGRVLDRAGKPVRNLRVQLQDRERPNNSHSVVTNAAGAFTASNLAPASYIVQVVPGPTGETEDLIPFTEDAFKIVEEDVAPAYSPGGVPSPDLAVPIKVTGGAIANAGTITVRKIPYYHVRVSLNGECAPNERWTYRIRADGNESVPSKRGDSDCRKDFLLPRVPAGSHSLGVWTGRNIDRWALASFTVTDKNTQTILNFNTTGSFSGRVTSVDGTDVSKLGKVSVLLYPSNDLPRGTTAAQYDPDGRFTIPRVPWTTQSISVEPSNPDTYVKEVRLNGLPLRSPQFDIAPGASLDIVLDSGAAQLTVLYKPQNANDFGLFLLIPTTSTDPSPTPSASPPFSFPGGFARGPAILNNIPPGEYRIFVLPLLLNDERTDRNATAERLARAQRVTLGRGEKKSIEL